MTDDPTYEFALLHKVLMLMAEELRRLSSARPTPMLLFQVLAIGLVTLALATIAGPRLAHAEALAAWVELRPRRKYPRHRLR